MQMRDFNAELRPWEHHFGGGKREAMLGREGYRGVGG